jgi:hypothetical protein
MGAWTLTPRCFFGALTRFFPKNIGLTLDLRCSAHPDSPCNATSTRHAISGLQSFHYVQAPMLARPPGCTHRCGSQMVNLAALSNLPMSFKHLGRCPPENFNRAAGPFTPRNGRVVTHTNCGIATYPNRAIGMAGLSPAGLQPCRPLPSG